MKDEAYEEELVLGGDFSGREKQDVFPAASMDGFTAARKIPSQYQRLGMKKVVRHDDAG
jgi:hypothetical protein